MTRTIASALLLAAAATTAGCGARYMNGPEHALTVEEDHPIAVDSQTVTMTMPLSADAGLSDIDKARVRAFARAYLGNGHGALTMTTPAASGAAQDQTATIRAALHAEGVPHDAMAAATYRVGEGSTTDIILSYVRYVATPSACGIWEGERERGYRNMRTPNFGCATQNNLAAMIGDPRDLVEPAAMTDPDAAIRIRGVQLFREGAVTSSDVDGDVDAKVSK